MIKTMSENKTTTSQSILMNVGILAIISLVGLIGIFTIKTKSEAHALPVKQSNLIGNHDTNDQKIPHPYVPPKEELYLDLIRNKLNKTNKKSILIIGDSQTKRSIMGQIKDVWNVFFDAQYDGWAVEGVSPRTIKTRHVEKRSKMGNLLREKLSSKPPIIYIQLGDNGIDTVDENVWLLDFINTFYQSDEKPTIIWSGPFPICSPNNRSTSYLSVLPCNKKNKRCLPTYQKIKQFDFTDKIREAISQFDNAFFITPYVGAPFNIPNTKCFTSDGIHITMQAMNTYLNDVLNRKVSQ
jgi:hypothetical protein